MIPRQRLDPTIRALYETPVSDEEWARIRDLPRDPESDAETVELARWFLTRYPTAKERFAYVRRKYVEWTRHPTEAVDPLEHAIVQVLRGHPEVELAILFGSRARGTSHAKSDVDLAIRGDTDRLALAAEASLACGQEVDVVDLDTAGVPLLEALVRDGRKLYEARPGRFATWRAQALGQLEIDGPWYRRMRDAWLARLARGQ